MKKYDTLLCNSKEKAHRYIDAIGDEYIHDWEFKEEGKVLLYLKDGWKKEKTHQ